MLVVDGRVIKKAIKKVRIVKPIAMVKGAGSKYLNNLVYFFVKLIVENL